MHPSAAPPARPRQILARPLAGSGRGVFRATSEHGRGSWTDGSCDGAGPGIIWQCPSPWAHLTCAHGTELWVAGASARRRVWCAHGSDGMAAREPLFSVIPPQVKFNMRWCLKQIRPRVNFRQPPQNGVDNCVKSAVKRAYAPVSSCVHVHPGLHLLLFFSWAVVFHAAA